MSMFWFKQKPVVPEFDHEVDIRQFLEMHELVIAVAVAKTAEMWEFDQSSGGLRFHSDLALPGSVVRRLVGVVHFDIFRETHVRAAVDFQDKTPVGSLGNVQIERYVAGSARVRSNRDRMSSKLDPYFYVGTTISDAGGQIFSRIQQSMRDNAASGVIYTHLSLELPSIDVDETVGHLSQTGRATIPINRIRWATDVTLPKSSQWAWKWEES